MVSDWTKGPRHCRGYPTISAGKGKGMVAKVLERYMDKGERIANASLIAAAPELYEALDRLERTAGIPASNDDPARVAARSALAKARGEQQ